jgi:hypothetical protein
MRSSAFYPLTASSFNTGSKLPVSRLNGLRRKGNSREDHRKVNPELGGEVAMLRKRTKRKSIALSLMRDVQGSAAEKLRMFEKVPAAGGSC